jgi:NAD(P)-dependent dehydrogenase (short-subunit alcohol dehydrogenase family)
LVTSLAGKEVIVTGAGGALGRAFAQDAAGRGAYVTVNDIDEATASETADSIRAAGGQAAVAIADITTWEGAGQLVERVVRDRGRLDGLVNNAGVFAMQDLSEADEPTIRKIIEVNVLGTMFCGLFAIRQMLVQAAGSVVNITSGAHFGLPDQFAYGASKGAVASATYCWAVDLAGTGVRVNAVSPRAQSRMFAAAQRFRESRGNLSPLGEGPSPAANAPLVSYLLSDAAAGVHGQIVRIDGDLLGLCAHPAVLVPVHVKSGWDIESVRRAFESDLVHRQQPVGIVGVEPVSHGAAAAQWPVAADQHR